MIQRVGWFLTVMEQQSALDARLDEALEETFPASDTPAISVEGSSARPPDRQVPLVTDNRAAHRFELEAEGQTAVLYYDRKPDSFVLVHTEVPPPLRGRRYGEALVKAALATAHSERLRIDIVCPFARAYLRKHPEQL